MVVLTALELAVIRRVDVEHAARITALCGLAMAKVALLLWVFMDLRAQNTVFCRAEAAYAGLVECRRSRTHTVGDQQRARATGQSSRVNDVTALSTVCHVVG